LTFSGRGTEAHDAGTSRTQVETSRRPVSVWLAVGAITLVGGLVPLALAQHFGALGIPRNDDWSYARSAFLFADHGTITGNGWASMNLVGQLAVSTPVVLVFGHRITALQVEVTILGVLGLVAVFDLAKRVISPRRALFVALMVAVGPMWASLSVSFMTDVPAFALAMVSLAVGSRALRDDDLDGRLYAVSLLAGFAAFTVREYALVAPVAVAVAALWLGAQRFRARLAMAASLLAGLLVAAAAFLLWRRGLPGFSDLTPAQPDPSSVRSAFQLACRSAVLVGVLTAPAVVLAGPTRLVRAAWARAPRTSIVVGFVTVSALVAESARHRGSGAFLGPGDYVMSTGTLDTYTVSGSRPDLLPKALLLVLALVGIATALLLVLAAIPPTLDALASLARRRVPVPASPALAVVGLAAVGYGLAYALPTGFRVVTFDRYLLPLLPLVAVLVLRATRPTVMTRPQGRIAGGAAVAALAALAVFGLIYAANSASFDGTKWKIAKEVSKAAGGATRVQGGFEWNNAHTGREVFLGKKPGAQPVGHFCVVLRAERHDPRGPEVLRAARVWGPPDARLWIVARRQSC
jgi:4-amino-4-deoxy-L-arabinose transferase-like glycosyltransferase